MPKKAKAKPSKAGSSDLLSAGNAAALLGMSANGFHHLKARHSDFPKPVNSQVKAGNLYRKSAIVAWAKKHGRM
jgi:predicted DNA-binding transcriptional regulator AlpA